MQPVLGLWRRSDGPPSRPRGPARWMRGQLDTRTPVQRLVALLLGLVAACTALPAPAPHPGVGAGSGMRGSASASPPLGVPSTSAAASAGAPSPTTPDSALAGAIAALCGSRPGCTVAAVHPAGASPEGVPLAVVELIWPLDAEERCTPRDLWLLSPRAGALAPRRLRRLCNDGYGSSGVGEDNVRVGANRFEHHQYGGSAWRWSHASEEQLEPPRLLGFGDLGVWNVGSNCESTAWSWESFSGTGAWFVPRCGEEDEHPAGDEACTEWPLVPLVPLGESFRRQGWQGTDLGDCALVLGASGAASAPTDPGGAVLRVLALDPRTLLVEVDDAALVPGARLVLTHSDWARPDYGQHCYESAAPPPRRAELRFIGTPPRPRARGAALESVAFAGGLRLLVEVPAAAPLLALELFAPDRAKAERRLASTSIGPPTTVTLGELWSLPADACALRDGRLEPRRSDALPPPVDEP